MTGVPIDLFGADLKHWWRDGYTPGSFVDLVGGADLVQATGAKQPSATTVDGHSVPLFDGADDVLSAGDITTLDGADELTIFFAFKAPSNTDYTGVFGKVYAGQAFWISVLGGNIVAAVSEDLAVGDAGTDATPFDDEWHRAVYTWSSAAGGTFTLDGVLQSTTEPPGASPIANTSEPLAMGAFMSSGGVAVDNFEGALGCVGIATRRATAPEIAQLDAMLAQFVGIAVASLNVTLTWLHLSVAASPPFSAVLFPSPSFVGRVEPTAGVATAVRASSGFSATLGVL